MTKRALESAPLVVGEKGHFAQHSLAVDYTTATEYGVIDSTETKEPESDPNAVF